MHCSADLTEELDAADADKNGVWDQAESLHSREQGTDGGGSSVDATTTDSHVSSTIKNTQHSGEMDANESLFHPDSILDNTLTTVIGILGGIVIGIIETVVLVVVTESGWAFLIGILAWLGITAYLVRRRTVHDALAKSGYAVAVVLLLIPVIVLTPAVTVEGGFGERIGLFLMILLIVAVPASIAAAIGWIASQFIPAE